MTEKPRLVADRRADAGYISDAPVTRTEQFAASVLVDVDAAGAMIGIELLTLAAAVDVDALADRYGLSAAVADEIRDALDGMRP